MKFLPSYLVKTTGRLDVQAQTRRTDDLQNPVWDQSISQPLSQVKTSLFPLLYFSQAHSSDSSQGTRDFVFVSCACKPQLNRALGRSNQNGSAQNSFVRAGFLSNQRNSKSTARVASVAILRE
ncbi:hypothetical protein [Caballeronia udeis]